MPTIPMLIRRLTPDDASAFRALRLFALQEAPSAFASSYEEEVTVPVSTIEARLGYKRDRGVFGAFADDSVVGLIGLGREDARKLSHKARVWGMYVAPEVRGKGIGRRLLIEALTFARSIPDIMQVNLCVNAANTSAIRLYESVGFKPFGREPGAMRIHGELLDEIHMSLRFSDMSDSM